jgi:hypothetical protein
MRTRPMLYALQPADLNKKFLFRFAFLRVRPKKSTLKRALNCMHNSHFHLATAGKETTSIVTKLEEVHSMMTVVNTHHFSPSLHQPHSNIFTAFVARNEKNKLCIYFFVF